MTSPSSTLQDHSVFITSPSFTIDLAAVDALHPIHYSRRLSIFRCTSTTQCEAQLESLKAGLQALVSRCPILGGIVCPSPSCSEKSVEHDDDDDDDNNNNRRRRCTVEPGPGLELVVKNLQRHQNQHQAQPQHQQRGPSLTDGVIASFEELESAGFPPLQLLYDLLVPVPQTIPGDRPFAACRVQFSVIDGGTIIAFAMSHSIADGGGTNELMRILGEETKLAHENRTCSGDLEESGCSGSVINTLVGLDRSLLRDVKSDVTFQIKDHPGFVLNNSTETGQLPSDNVSTHLFKAVSSEVPTIFRVSAYKLAQLKTDATQPGMSPISSHDALSALVWRSVILIRSRRSSTGPSISSPVSTSIYFPADARRYLNLPESYVGNAVYQLTAELNLDTILSSSGLKHAAGAVRRAIKAMNPAIVSSYMAQVNKKWLDWAFLATASTTGVAMGTDWTSGVLYTHDWGKAFGKMVSYRYPDEPAICVLPKLPNGDAEVMISVMPHEVEMLRSDECLGLYISM